MRTLDCDVVMRLMKFLPLLLVSLFALDVHAQALAETKYCTGSGCFSTKANAEQAMRAAIPGGNFLEYVGTGVFESDANRYSFNYSTKPRGPETLYATGYYAGVPAPYNNAPCARTGTPYNPNACADYTELAQSIVQMRIADENALYAANNINKTCSFVSITYRGSFLEPYGKSTVVAGTDSRGAYLNESGVVADFQYYCASTTAGNDLRTGSIPFTRIRDYVCPNGFTAAHDPYVNDPRWPNLCVSGGAGYITAYTYPLKKTCPVNDRPCYPGTNDKARFEIDLEFAGRTFKRNYHSAAQIRSVQMAPGWSHSYGYKLIRAGGWGEVYVYLDGDGYLDRFNGIGGAADATAASSLGSERKLVKATVNGVVALTVIERNGEQILFDADGVAQKLRSVGGNSSVSFQYENGSLISATDDSGRSLVFAYDPNGKLSRVTQSDGSYVEYAYDPSNGNLLKATYSSGEAKTYHYAEAGLSAAQDPSLLTGITSEDGARYSEYKYDSLQRPIYSGLRVGGNAVNVTAIVYDDMNHFTVNQESGFTSQYSYSPNSFRNIDQIVAPEGAVSYAYDSGGRRIQMTDKRGVQTTYSYADVSDAVLGAVRRVTTNEAVGTPQMRTIQTDLRLPLLVPAERRTYDAAGVLVEREVWTYNSRGQVLTRSVIEP